MMSIANFADLRAKCPRAVCREVQNRCATADCHNARPTILRTRHVVGNPTMNFDAHENGMRLLEADFDQPPPAAPAHLYLICNLPRSGSWALCRMLVRLGLGLPSEYFHQVYGHAMAARLGAPVTRNKPAWDYLSALLRVRATSAGHVGIKVNLNQLRFYFPGPSGARLLQRARLIYLFRQDVLAQAVSFNFAQATGHWQKTGTPDLSIPGVAPDDFRRIDKLIDQLTAQESLWRRSFAKLGLRPCFVAYEEIIADPAASLVRVARFLDAAPEQLDPGRIAAAIETGTAPDRPVQGGPSKSEVLAAYMAARRPRLP
jgi:LPS sulfotransferase NodH